MDNSDEKSKVESLLDSDCYNEALDLFFDELLTEIEAKQSKPL